MSKEYMRELRKDPIYKQKHNEWYKAYTRTPHGWQTKAISRFKYKAKKLNLAFDLEYDDFTIPNFCPVLGIPIDLNDDSRENSPSVDRIDNSKGYVKGNIKVICNKANRIKSDSTVEELEKIIAYMKNSNA